MQCTNCGQVIAENEPYYRAGWNKTTFCSYSCAHDMYRDLCTDEKIDESIEWYTYVEKDAISPSKGKTEGG